MTAVTVATTWAIAGKVRDMISHHLTDLKESMEKQPT